jgi:hypothetical protein
MDRTNFSDQIGFFHIYSWEAPERKSKKRECDCRWGGSAGFPLPSCSLLLPSCSLLLPFLLFSSSPLLPSFFSYFSSTRNMCSTSDRVQHRPLATRSFDVYNRDRQRRQPFDPCTEPPITISDDNPSPYPMYSDDDPLPHLSPTLISSTFIFNFTYFYFISGSLVHF